MERVTKWYQPTLMTNGKYGRCNNLEWLEFEKKRFMEMGKIVTIKPHPKIANLYALFVDQSSVIFPPLTGKWS